MDGTGAGTAIMLAVAALLWFLYLVPTWLRRREFIAAEHGAGRPERLIRAEQRRADAAAAREARAVRRAATASSPRPSLDTSVLRRRRMRRTRLSASLLMVAATVVLGVQIWLIATTGMTLGAFFVLVAAISGGGAAIATQRRLDALAMPRAAAPLRQRTPVQVPAATASARPRAASWTPVETPRPMYLSRPAPESAVVRADLQEALRAAAAEAEANLRAAQAAPEVTRMRPSKYSGMGVLGADAVEERDLDEVLRRRRSAG
jgi:hypothetical protein